MYLPANGNASCVKLLSGYLPESPFIFSDDCSTAKVVGNNGVPYFLSLLPNGTVVDVTAPHDVTQAEQKCSLQFQSPPNVLPSVHTLIFSPNQQHLAVVCRSIDDTAILGLLLLEWPSSSLLASTIYQPSTNDAIMFSYDSRFLAFARKSSVAVWDLTRPDYALQQLIPPLQDLPVRYSFAFSMDSQYLLAYGSDYNGDCALGRDESVPFLRCRNRMEVFPVTGRGYLEAACALVARDLTNQEWNSYGMLDEKDHVICPGRVMADGCFGVPLGGEVSEGGHDLIMDVCYLESFSYAVQLSLNATLNTTYQLSTILSNYPTSLGVYDDRCSLPALAYSLDGMVNVTTSDAVHSRRLYVVVSSTDPLSCGTLRLSVNVLSAKFL